MHFPLWVCPHAFSLPRSTRVVPGSPRRKYGVHVAWGWKGSSPPPPPVCQLMSLTIPQWCSDVEDSGRCTHDQLALLIRRNMHLIHAYPNMVCLACKHNRKIWQNVIFLNSALRKYARPLTLSCIHVISALFGLRFFLENRWCFCRASVTFFSWSNKQYYVKKRET